MDEKMRFALFIIISLMASIFFGLAVGKANMGIALFFAFMALDISLERNLDK